MIGEFLRVKNRQENMKMAPPANLPTVNDSIKLYTKLYAGERKTFDIHLIPSHSYFTLEHSHKNMALFAIIQQSFVKRSI